MQLELIEPPRRLELQRQGRPRGLDEAGHWGVDRWLQYWRQRHLCGDPVRVLRARDGSHLLAVVDAT